MLLFFSPVLNLLSESRKQSRLVFWGVELIPTPDANKSLQVSGDFHAQLLSYIKHYIDETIAEMEASETAPQTEEIESPYSSETEIALLNEVVDKKATQSEPKTNSSSFSKIETDGVESVETEPTPQKPEIVNTEAVEVGETEDTEVVETDETDDDIENWPTPSVEATDNNSKELNEEPTALEMAGNTFTGLVSTPKLLSGSENGNPPDLQASKPNDAVQQTELDLKTNPKPEPEIEAVPTPLLEAVEREIKKGNPELTIVYHTGGNSTFLNIYHGDMSHGSSYVGYLEDDGKELWHSGLKRLKNHGFTQEQLDVITEMYHPKS